MPNTLTEKHSFMNKFCEKHKPSQLDSSINVSDIVVHIVYNEFTKFYDLHTT